jgi:4,5:9,10-diseco-3-hydroxy-5,9,17-trioxoandrosta-1(10),2-diene-4-oate hydrolase
MQQAEYKTVNIWGLDVRYIEAGEGPVVLLLYGLADSLLSWYCNIDVLADAGFRVIAPDLPGCGESDKPDHLDYHPGSAAEFIYDFTQELGIPKLSLVGNSAGGLIVGLCAIEHPEIVENMVLVAPGGFGRRVSWLLRAISIPVVGDLLYRPWLNKKIGITKHLFHRPPEVLKELLPEMNRMKALPGARAAVLSSIRSNIDLRGVRKDAYILERLKGSSVPLLTVWGAEDSVIPIEYADDARRELPDSVVRVIQECGHWPQMEKPDQFNPILISFLKGDSVPKAQDQS